MNQHEKIVQFLKQFRSEVILAFEKFEPSARFEKKPWNHHSGGGGEMGVIRGEVFEKGAVNWSGVSGPTLPKESSLEDEGPFFATGVSIITHMHNPHAPTVHLNLRYFETPKQWWFGGGYDLTPMGFPYPEDTKHFHETARLALDTVNPHLYQTFSENARAYFFIPHRHKERGVGGIFFDRLNSGSFENDFNLCKLVASTFLSAILPIYERRTRTSFTPTDKEEQLKRRSEYVEFNLLYDRGTKFGLTSGGNPQAIFCSMPPIAKWS